MTKDRSFVVAIGPTTSASTVQAESSRRLSYHLSKHARTPPRLRADATKIVVPQGEVRELHADAAKHVRALARACGGGAGTDGK
jgi:hypothetical protein